jgi:hypothetical protein
MSQAEHKAREDQEREAQRAAFDQKRREAEVQLAEGRRQLDDLLPQLTAKEEEKRQADQALHESPRDKDLKARANLLSGELFRVEKQRKSLDASIKGAERTLLEEFEFRPSRPSMPSSKDAPRGAKGFIPEAPGKRDDPVPAEEPPSVGRLMQHKSERYLVISRWEELSQGERDAERLKARLVAPPEGT